MLSKHQGGRPRVLLSDAPELRALCLAYKDELDEFEHSRLRHAPYGLATLPGGFVLTSEIRRVARRSLVGELAVFPPVLDAIEDPRAFVSWLYDSSVGICPAQWIRWNTRPDLQHAFPDPLDRDAESFQDWWFGDMNPAPERRYLRRSPRAHQSKTPKRRAFGWSVIAYARGELGIGEAGRRIADVVAACGLPMELVGTTLSSTSRQGHAAVRDVRDTVGFENVITCVNADILPSLSDRLELPKLRGQHVGLWFWELEEFPGHYGRSLALVHEVWAASEFTRRAIQRITDKPVRLIRLPIEIPDQPTAFTRRSLGMPESDFVFLTNFDYLSVCERKNPGGVIRAYMAAFGPDDGVRLIVKSINSGLRVADAERTRSFAAGRSDVLFFDDYVSSSQIKAMIELADCYVSLHRSEGYGLNLADAMARGTPTIATGYSGNLEFMTPTTSILIPHTIVEVGPGAEPYNPHAIWAEPNLHAASTAMRRLFDDRAFARTLAGRARDHVARWHSLAASTDSLRETLMGTAVGKRT